MPVSLTTSTAICRCWVSLTVIRPPGWVNLIALLSRLLITRSKSITSPITSPSVGSSSRSTERPALAMVGRIDCRHSTTIAARSTGRPSRGPRAAVVRREREEVLDQRAEPDHVALDDREPRRDIGAELAHAAVAHQLEVAHDARQRRAQLVGDGADEGVLGLVELLEPAHRLALLLEGLHLHEGGHEVVGEPLADRDLALLPGACRHRLEQHPADHLAGHGHGYGDQGAHADEPARPSPRPRRRSGGRR